MARKTPQRGWLILAAGGDELHATWLQQTMHQASRQADVALWRAELPGTEARDLADEIERLLHRCLGVIGILSKGSLGGAMPRTIWLTVLRDHLLGERPFLAVQFEACDPSTLLGQLPYVRLGGNDVQQSVNALFQVIYGLEQYPSAVGAGRHELTHLPGLPQSDRASSLVHISRQFADLDDMESALACTEAAFAIRQRILGPGDPLLSATLLTCAEFAAASGQRVIALEQLHKTYERLRSYPWNARTIVEQWSQLERLVSLAARLGDAELQENALALQRDMLPRMKGKGIDEALLAVRAGRLAQRAGDVAGAIMHFQEALTAWRQEAPDDPAELARLLNDLGALMLQQGDPITAIAHLTDACRRWRAIQGRESAEVATTYINQSVAYRAMSDLTSAHETIIEALQIRLRICDPIDPLIASTLHHLASVEELEGHLTEAEAHYRQALVIFDQHEASMGDAGTVRNNLAMCLERQGRHADAGALLEQAWSGVCSRLGTEHPACIPVLENRIAQLERTGQLRLALERRQTLLTLLQEGQVEDPAAFARHWRLVATLATRLGEREQARGALDEAERYVAQMPDNAEEREALRPLRAQCEAEGGDPQATVRLLETALKEMLRTMPINDPALIPSLEELATLQSRCGDFASAATYLERVLHLREKQLGLTDPGLIPTLLQLGQVHKAKGSSGTAQSLAKRASKLIAQVPNPPAEWGSLLAALLA